MPYIFVLITLVFIGSVFGLPDRGAAEATQTCYGNKWGGANCVEIRYQLIFDKQLQAPDEMQKQFQVFENLAKEKEMKTVAIDGSNYNLYTNQQNSEKKWTLDGWVLYRLANPEEARKFTDALQALQFNATQHQEETCFH